MNKQEFENLDAAKQLQIRESFDFLNDIDVNEIAGEKFLTKDGIPLNAITEMSESQFVRDWIIQFALNNTATNNNYFNFIEWGKISNQHTMCVMVVDDNDSNNTLFVVKPLSSYEMSPMEREVMRQTSAALRSTIQEVVEGQRPQMDPNSIVETAKNYLEADSRKPIHELVPQEFYRKHNVWVDALRKVIWLRDEFFKGQVSQEVLFKIKDIFEKEERDGCATREEYEYVKSLCPLFNIPEELLAQHGDKGVEIKNNQQDYNTGIDPMSC